MYLIYWKNVFPLVFNNYYIEMTFERRRERKSNVANDEGKKKRRKKIASSKA